MSTLSRRGPNANTPARLPGLQTSRIADLNTRQALDALREWVEVRLGARGDRFERAVTFRDFDPLTERVQTLESAAPTDIPEVQPFDASGLQLDINALTAAQAALRRDFDTAVSNLTAVLGNLLTLDQIIAALLGRQNEFMAAQTTRQQTVPLDETDGGLFVAQPDGALSTTFYVEATEDFELQTPTALADGATYTFVLQQDITGGRVITFEPLFDFGSVTPTPGTDPRELTLVRGVAHTGVVGSEERTVLLCEIVTGFASLVADVRVTELADTRVTEDGDRRVLKV